MAKELEMMTPKELQAQADALLAAAEAEEVPAMKPTKKTAKKKAATEETQEAPRVMTDEEAKQAGIVRLDDKQVAALPAANWLINNEKLRELLQELCDKQILVDDCKKRVSRHFIPMSWDEVVEKTLELYQPKKAEK